MIGRTRVLAFKIVLKIYYKSFFEYLVVEDIAKSSKTELRVESGIDSLFNSFFLLLTKKKA